MIALFRQKSPANILLLLVFGVLIKLPMFLHPHTVTVKTGDDIGYSTLLKFIEPTARYNPSLFPLLAFILLFLQAVILTGIINKHKMISRTNYFPGMAYLLITSLFPAWNYFSAPLLVNTILLIILSGLFSIYNQQNAKSTLFNAGLSLGIAAFIFFPSITFVAWILLALAVMRPFRLNEWLLCILGIITPFYFYAIYLFMVDQLSWQHLWPHFTISLPYVQQSAWLAGSAFLLAVPFFIGGYYVQENLRKMLIQVRKGWSLVLLYLLGAIFIPFVNNSNSFENWVMAAIPFAAFHACTYFYSTLRIVPVLLFWVTLAFVLGYQYYGPGW